MSVIETFIELTRTTVPHGFEHTLYPHIPNPIIDVFGNAKVVIGEKPTVMFTSHLDTYGGGDPEPVKVKFKKNLIKTNGSTILGADDKAGVAVMLEMIKHEIPGMYYFFVGEELGRLGSQFVATSDDFLKEGKHIKSVISFDRRGYGSVITHQAGYRTCSDRFATKVCEAMDQGGLKHLRIDEYGGRTDSYTFANVGNVINCTNISMGYFNAHTTEEYQDATYLKKVANAAISFDWQTL